MIKKLGTILIAIFFAMILLTSNCFATHDTNGKMLGLYDTGNGRPSGYYTTGSSKNAKRLPLIKIVEYNSAGTIPDASKSTQAIYCLKDGVGFGSEGSTGNIVKYTEYFDLKNPSSITPSDYMSVLPSGEDYNKLIWLLDNLCIPENEDSVQTLLQKADATELKTTISDTQELKDVIEIIQQAAIWYITNANDDYQPTRDATFYVADNNGGLGTSLISKYHMDLAENPISNLYNYLIDQAEANENYSYTSQATAPLSFTKTGAKAVLSNGKFLIGPYRLTINNNNYTSFNAKVLNDQFEINNVDIVNNNSVSFSGTNTSEKILDAARQSQDFYISLPSTTSVSQVKVQISASMAVTNLEYWSEGLATIQQSQPVVIITKKNADINFSDTQNIEKPKFDLALRKFITQIAGQNVTPSREPKITQENLRALAEGSSLTFDGTTTYKNHSKSALPVKTGNTVVYTIRVYNEGEIDGYAEEITDYLPDGLELVPREQSSINATYGWQVDGSDSRIIRTTYLSQQRNANQNVIKAFNTHPENGQFTISYKDVQVECKVVAITQSTDTHLKNVAEITKDSGNDDISDRDSVPKDIGSHKDNYAPGTSEQGKGYEDDDDYEDLVLPGTYFDVALRKFITAVNDVELSTNGVYDRAPVVDVSPLLNGQTTANYKHTKSPVSVSPNDIVTFTIRVYNEGQVDGYIDEIVDHLPPELEFLPEDKINTKYLWTIDSSDRTQRTIRTNYLSQDHDAENVLKAFDTSKTTLDYKEVQIRCKVSSTAPTLKKLTNIAEITASSNELQITDRDNKKNATLPQDSVLPDYKGKDSNDDDLSKKDYYYEGQEDDDDFEKLILEKFDLALRKFITGVNNEQVTSREPQVDASKYGTIVDGKEITDMEYNHTKDPVRVANNDIVIYTIRVYNEGTKPGYASEIKDDLPEGLLYLPDNAINEQYGWVMYDEDGNITTDASKAVSVRTNYLSKDSESEPGEFLLKAYDAETMDGPDYRDVQIAFLVTEPNTSDRILTNHAEISDDTDENGKPVEDIDSTPDDWQEEDDDQDVEHVYVKYFDLALRKWVSQVILIEDGVQKEMDTGHYAEQDPEPAVKVELNKKRIENTIVKFRYQIRITNEGEIEGYATEISDYIPDGLMFNQADNPKWREEDNKIVTDQLKDTLLQPGESATVEVVLTWINGEDNLNLKTNVAEISEDDNPSDSPDIDSTPNNKKPQEDDIDDAPVILTIVTGLSPTYIALITGTIFIIGVGAFVIKKYVV